MFPLFSKIFKWLYIHIKIIAIILNFLCATSLQSCPALLPYGLYPARLLCPCDTPGKNTGISCHALLQGIFLTQGSNFHLTSPALADRFLTTSPTFSSVQFSCSFVSDSFRPHGLQHTRPPCQSPTPWKPL